MEIIKYTMMPNKPAPPSNIRTVPLLLFQTWHTNNLPPKMYETAMSLQRDNPEFKYIFSNDAECRNFIKDKFDADVLFAYDRLIPGAYKADLWRYCALYTFGGIYMDMKFSCIPPFKMIELTTQETFIQDRKYGGNPGIYQGVFSCYPKNPILYACIRKIVDYVKQLHYGETVLFLGPLLVANQFPVSEIKRFPLKYTGLQILRDKTPVLQYYPEYVEETKQNSIRSYYMDAWCTRSIYELPSLTLVNTIFLTRVLKTDQYLSDVKWIDDGNERLIYGKYSSYVSYEDGTYTGSSQGNLHHILATPSTFTGKEETYPINMDQLVLYKTDSVQYMCIQDSSVFQGPSLTCTTLMTSQMNRVGSPVKTDDVYFIHTWYPMVFFNTNLQYCRVNYDTPPFFKDLTSMTPCVLWKNQYWTILTKCIEYEYNSKMYKKYAHLFVVLNKDLFLVKYSEFFIVEHSDVATISDLHLQGDTLLIAYTISNGICMVSEYEETSLHWTNYVSS